MTASNLAICVGPSVLWSTDPAIMVDQSYSKHVSNVAQILIEEYFNIFGESPPYIYGKLETSEQITALDAEDNNEHGVDGDDMMMMMVESEENNVNKMLVKGGSSKSKFFPQKKSLHFKLYLKFILIPFFFHRTLREHIS